MKVRRYFGIFLILHGIFIDSALSVIVPQELPSILSLIYSNIPPVKKGTDSRLGFGFRLGDHADFQVQLELGPQKETRPIGDAASSSSNSKRHVNPDDYPRPGVDLSSTSSPTKSLPKKVVPTNKEASKWLTNWSNDMKKMKKNTVKQQQIRQELDMFGLRDELAGGIPTIQTMTLIPESALKQLQLLYKQNPTISYEEVKEIEEISVRPDDSLKKQDMGKNAEQTVKPNRRVTTADLMNVELN